MNGYHWGAIIMFLLIGYFLGVFFPVPGTRVRTAIGV